MQTISKTINVTQSHINQGRQGDACWCPVALAIAEAIGLKPGEASVTSYAISLSRSEWFRGTKAINPSYSVTHFVNTFDKDRYTVRPFTFELSVPKMM